MIIGTDGNAAIPICDDKVIRLNSKSIFFNLQLMQKDIG